MTYASPAPADAYISPAYAVYAATAPVDEYVTEMVSGENATPFTRTWVSPRNSASMSQRRVSNAIVS